MTDLVSPSDTPSKVPGQPTPLMLSRWLVPLSLALAVLTAITGSLCIGTYPISFAQAALIVKHLAWPTALPENAPWTLKQLTVIQMIRLPRVLIATLAGMGLGMAGASLQGIMRNPLVGPDLVGISSGAALGGVLALLWQWPPIGVVGLAFFGGLAAMGSTFGLATLVRGATDGIALILAGVFVGAFFVSCVGMVEFLSPDSTLGSIVHWLLGSFVQADRQKVWMVAIPTLGGGALLMLLRWRFNLLSLGDLDASALGVRVHHLRWTIIAIVSLIVAAQVSVSGTIGWVGLVVPHMARMLVGPDHRRLLPVSALIGALFILGIDDFTRSAIKAEFPVGILTALIGTPFICFLFWKTRSKGWIND